MGEGNVILPWHEHCTLSQCRILRAGDPNDDIVLDWSQFEPDEHTLGLWHMNEDAWTGMPGEVVDSSGNGHHGQAYNGATTAEGWKDRAGRFQVTSSQYVRVPYAATLNPTVVTAEAWVCWDGTGTWMRSPLTSRTSYPHAGWSIYVGDGPTWQVYWGTTNPAWGSGTSTISPEANCWQHIALCFNGAEGAEFYVNGELGLIMDTANYRVNPSGPLFIGCGEVGGGNPSFYFPGMVDEVRISSGLRYTSEFTPPPRYSETGSVTARHNLEGLRRLTAIAWSGTFGLDTGRLRRVWVYSGGDWQQVGGEYPSSPITGLSLLVNGPDLVRVELEPLDDTLRSETPTLDWLRVTLRSPSP